MNYKRFEDLPVWKAAVEFALLIFKFTNIADLRGLGDTKSQLERASLSISNNIAEGFERGTNAELINFLYIARGSAAECRSMLCLCAMQPRFLNFKFEISNLKGRAENVSKQLYGWLESLKDSKIKGNKYLTKQERDRIARDKEFAEFDRQMEEFRHKHLLWLEQRSEDVAMERMAEHNAMRRTAEEDAVRQMAEENAMRRMPAEEAVRQMAEEDEMLHTVEPA